MHLCAFFIKRPIATILLSLGVVASGILAFNLLPVASLPDMDFPTITVAGSLPGASPPIMATSVATPLERYIGRIAGITQLTSSSILGNTAITVQFDLARNINGAASDIQAAINAARAELPPDLPNNPTYRKVNPADAPILILALTSDVYSTGEMYDYASTILAQVLSQMEGVGQVIVGGGSFPAIRVELNPTALNNYGISLIDVENTISAANILRPKGGLNAGINIQEIATNDQLLKPSEYSPLIIRYTNGHPVRIQDVGQVIASVENIRNAGLSNGKPAVMIVVFKQPGANVVSAVDKVLGTLPFLKATVPAAIDISIAMDRTTTIRASLHDVEFTLIIAIFLVIFIVYIFLGNVRAMLIPSVAVPLSLLGTFSVMELLGYTLDNLSLMALTISTGFVVDDAVVVLENIARYIEKGLEPYEAALIGAKEVTFTVLSMSVSLIAVFIPILFMGGIVGRLFREFAVVLSLAIFVSMIVSLTVTPTMCAYLLRKEHFTNANTHLFIRLFHKMQRYYQPSLRWALNHQKSMLFLLGMAILLNISFFIIIPKGFFPQQDTGRIIAQIQADQAVSFQAMVKKLKQLIDVVKKDEGVQNAVGFIGSTAGSTTNSGTVFISLKSLHERQLSVDEIINRLRQELEGVKGVKLYMQAAQDLFVGGRIGSAQYQYTLTADTLEELTQWGNRVYDTLRHIPELVDVNSDQLNRGLETYVNVDRKTATRLEIDMRNIDRTLYDAFGQAQVSIMYTPLNQYRVIMEVSPEYWQHPDTLKNIYVPNNENKLVPLSAFAEYTSNRTFLSVNHQGQSPAVTISFNLALSKALGDAVAAINTAIESLHMPETIHASFQGTAAAFQESLANEGFLILGALLTVYIVLGILYESMIHPLTILSTLPSAGVGALLALMLTGIDFTIIAMIGLILLIGIVKKNAIMMIDFALAEKRIEKKSPVDSIYNAALLRFRPIMMTTMAAIGGALPLALGTGIGSEFRRPLGISIIGGLTLSQLLTLYTTPIVYLMFERISLWNKKNGLHFKWMRGAS